MNKKIIGVVLVCLIVGLGIGYIVGYFTYPLAVEDLRQRWATLSILGGQYVQNYTARYTVYSQNGTSIPLTTVNGPYLTSLNITRPKNAEVGGLRGGWTIEVWATVTPQNGITPRLNPPDIVTIGIGWAGPNGGFDGLTAYGQYPTEAHLKVDLS